MKISVSRMSYITENLTAELMRAQRVENIIRKPISLCVLCRLCGEDLPKIDSFTRRAVPANGA